MSIYYKTAVRETKEVRPGSPAQAEEIVAAGVPIESLPGLGPNEKAILRLALNPHSGSARAAAELLAGLRNINIQANAPLWLRAEAVKSIVAQSRVSLAPEPPNPFESKSSRRGFWLVEGGPVVIPTSGDGQKKVENGLPIQKFDDGFIIAFDIPIWSLPWETFLLATLPYAMREIFRVDDFYPPPMSREIPAGLLSLNYRYGEGSEEFEFQDCLPDVWRGSTAAAALVDVFRSGLALDATERLIYLASTEGNATPQDLGLYLGTSADAAGMRQRRLLARVAKAAKESEVLRLVDSDLIWQPEGRVGPYDEHSDDEVFRLFERQKREWKSWSWQKSFGHWPKLADAYELAEAGRLLSDKRRPTSPNSTLNRYGGGRSLDELGRRAWTEPTLGSLEREPMSKGRYSNLSRLVAEGCDRGWAPRRAARITQGGSASPTPRGHHPDCNNGSCRGCWAWYPRARFTWGAQRDVVAPRPRGNSALPAPAPSREYKPRCLERGCSRRVASLYVSRIKPPRHTETKPPGIPEPKEKTDAHRYCKRHLRERKETNEVTQTEIAAGFNDLGSQLSAFQEETRRGIGQMLTALTWKFPDDEELLDAVDDWRRQIGNMGVQVFADE